MSDAPPYAVIGVFETPDSLAAAAARLRDLGYRGVEAYTPYPVEGLGEQLHSRARPGLPLTIGVSALIGACGGYFIQYWDEVLSYPINVGGRPYHSWPAFIVSAFEIMLLSAVTAGFFGLFAWCRLPRLYHPIFAAEAFERASRDRFVLSVDPHDPHFERRVVEETFRRFGAEQVVEVPA